MRCWFCGVEPLDVFEVTALGDAEPRFLANWPAGNHEHAERPPSPAQLEAAGHEALMRIRRQAFVA